MHVADIIESSPRTRLSTEPTPESHCDLKDLGSSRGPGKCHREGHVGDSGSSPALPGPWTVPQGTQTGDLALDAPIRSPKPVQTIATGTFLSLGS